jgi:hypothetical protein
MADLPLTVEEWHVPKILTVKLKQVEGVQHGLGDGATTVERVEDRDTIRTAYHGLSVEGEGPGAQQHRGDYDRRVTAAPVIAAPGEQASLCGRTTGLQRKKHWRSPSRRSTRSSIGPKILVVAGGVVAGVIGISGTYPEIIDADWVQSAGTDSPHSKNVAISDATTTRRSGIVAAIPLPPRRVAITTGEAAVSAPRPAAPCRRRTAAK